MRTSSKSRPSENNRFSLPRFPPISLLIVAVLFSISIWQNLSQVPLTRFNPDETRWINRAHYARDLFHALSATWADSYLTRGQPPVGSYVMGIGFLIQGRDLHTNGVWDFTIPDRLEYRRNVALGNMASTDDLRTGRRTSAGIGALTVAVLYLLVARLSNRAGGVAAGLFVAIHPYHMYISSLATSDATFGLLIALAALAACLLAERPSWPRALALGVLLGLGGATKLSPLLVTLPLGGLGALLLGRGWIVRWRPRAVNQKNRHRLEWMLLATPGIALFVFVAAYPYLWRDPVGHTANLFRFRVEEMHAQGANHQNLAVNSRGEAFRRIGRTLDARYSASQRVSAGAANALGERGRLPSLDLPLALVGAEVLAALAVIGGLRSPPALVTLVIGGQVTITVLGMQSEFDRYHVPMLVTTAICIGVLAGQGWTLVEHAAVARHTRAAQVVRRTPCQSRLATPQN